MSRERLLFKDYQKLFRTGKKRYSTYYLAYYLELSEDSQSLIKTSIKKRVGPAVVRNYEKRVMRMILSGLKWQKPILLLVLCHKKPDLLFDNKRLALIRLLKPLLA